MIARAGLGTCISLEACTLLKGSYNKSASSFAVVSKSDVPFGSSAPVGPPPPGTHHIGQTNIQNGPSTAGQQPHR